MTWRSLGPCVAGLLIAAFFLQSFFASGQKSPVYDEPPHIAAGLSYVSTGVFHANIQHPPLLKELAGLSLLLGGIRWPHSEMARQLIEGPANGPALEWPLGNTIIADNGPDKVMFWARLPFILLAALLGLLIYLWGRQMLGELAALGALFLYALDPAILAHSFLVTTDAGFAAFTLLFFYLLWNYLREPGRLRILWCGLAMGAVLGTKFSAPMLLPVAAILLLAAAAFALKPLPATNPSGRRKNKPPARIAWGQAIAGPARAFLLMCLVAFVVVQALYFFHNPLLYLTGLRKVNADHDPNHLTLVAGVLQPSRVSSYFAIVYFLKEPIANIVLAAAGLFALARNKKVPRMAKLFLLLPPAVLFASYSLMADNLGIRYIIPVLPFAYLVGGFGLAQLISSGSTWKRCLAGVLCVWLIVAAAGIYPDHLAYFNETACALEDPSLIGWDGGSKCGPAWLDENNVDWGQGLKQLKTWIDQHANGRTVRLRYFGSFPPEAYGIRCERISNADLVRPLPGLYVVSAHVVARIPAMGAAAWLRRPTAIIGHSLYVYEVVSSE